jgi:hypothetical protein
MVVKVGVVALSLQKTTQLRGSLGGEVGTYGSSFRKKYAKGRFQVSKQ